MTPYEQTLESNASSAAPAEGFSVLVRKASSVLGSHAVAALLGIASLPVLARALGPAEYGRVSLFLTLLGVVTYQDFLRPLLVRALAQHGQEDAGGLRALSSIVSWTLAAIAASIGLLLFTPAVAILFAIAVLAHGLASVDYARLALDGRVAGAAFVRNIAWGLAAASAACIAVTIERAGTAWVAAPFCAANVVILAIYRLRIGGAATGMWSSSTLSHARTAWSEHRRAILGLVGFGLANAVVVSADRLIAERFLDPHDFGLYAGCADLATKLAIVGSAIGTVLYPSFARHSDGSASEARRFVGIATRVMIGWGLLLAVLVLASNCIVPLVLGAEYATGAWICTALFAAAFVHMLGFLVTPWQRARGEFVVQTRAYAIAGVAMVCVGWALVPVLGIVGAVACACTARLAEIQLCVREARTLGSRVLSRRRIASLGALATALIALAWWRTVEFH